MIFLGIHFVNVVVTPETSQYVHGQSVLYSYVQNDQTNKSYLCSGPVITDKAKETS